MSGLDWQTMMSGPPGTAKEPERAAAPEREPSPDPLPRFASTPVAERADAEYARIWREVGWLQGIRR